MSLAVELAVAIVARTKEVGVCLFCDRFENQNTRGQHASNCPVGRYENHGLAQGEQWLAREAAARCNRPIPAITDTGERQ